MQMQLTQSGLRPRRLAPQPIQEFLFFEAELLSQRRFEEWMELLTEDISYWVPLRQGQTDAEQEASLFYDNLELLTSRLKRLRHPKMWSQLPPAHSTRLISNITLDDDYESNGTVYSQFIMCEFRAREQRVFGGSYEHQLRQVDGGFKIARKTVRLVNCEAMLSNLAVPF